MELLKHSDPKWVALVSVAENLPICLLSVVAGALADLLDRRKLLIFTQVWMLLASGLLGILTLKGLTTPGMLLFFTATLGVGIALSGPPFQAIVPELVAPADMPLAVALNSVALNVARAIGPALGMIVVIAAGRGTRGPGASFLLNAASFVGVAYVLYRWKRPKQKETGHAEQIWGALKLGFQYTRHSPPMIAILVRVAAFILCAVAMWAQLPVIAHNQLGLAEGGYAILMACLGAGAVIGVVMMPKLQRLLSIDRMVAVCTGSFAVGLILLGLVRDPAPAYLLMLFLGFNWVIIPTNFNVATQRSVPNWVKGRALSMYLTTLFGCWTIASFVWGTVAKHTSISTALLLAGSSMALGLAVFGRFRLTLGTGQDFSPAFGATRPPPVAPVIVRSPNGKEAWIQWPLHVGTEQYAKHVRELRRQRLRNGARSWHLVRMNAPTEHWRERIVFHYETGLAQLHSRTTKADWMLQERIRGMEQVKPAELKPPKKHPLPAWLARNVYFWLDRTLDETEKAIRRFEGAPSALPTPERNR